MQERIRAAVEKLCAPELAGRETGTPEGRAARDWIAGQFEALGLLPTAPGFVQPLPDINGGNVIGHLDGTSERTILVAAHYDHLGRTGDDAFWGADDNAAAVAILFEVARALKVRTLGRRVLFCAFDAEEPPHFLGHTMGSQSFVAEPLVPLDGIDLMICMDLMGHALGPEAFDDGVRQTVFALGAETSEGTAELVDGANARTNGVHVRRLGGDVVPPLSDYHAFRDHGVPYLFLTCGRWAHYHQTTDTPEKLDYDKIAASARFLTELVADVADREGPTTFDPHRRDDAASIRSLREIGALLAKTIPDMVAQADVNLADLERAVEARGYLGKRDQQTLSALVRMLESLLE